MSPQIVSCHVSVTFEAATLNATGMESKIATTSSWGENRSVSQTIASSDQHAIGTETCAGFITL
jgi:hypothetical protein